MTKEQLAMYTQKHAIVDQCVGCDRASAQGDATNCSVFPNPWYKWSVGACNMATHVKSEVVQQAKMLNPLKASKQKARGRG